MNDAWVCPSCGMWIHGTLDACFVCGSPKPEEMHDQVDLGGEG